MSDSGRAPDPPDSPVSTSAVGIPPTRLYMVRHAQSEWNRERRIQGQADPPLSERGLEQAARLAATLGQRSWAGFYTSDLARARQTSEALEAGAGCHPEPLPALREVALGEWEGLTAPELEARFPAEWAAWRREPDWDLAPGGEGGQSFESRVASVVDEILARHPTGNVLVVTHGGVIQVSLGRILGRGSRGAFPFRISNASVTLLERTGPGLTIGGVNLTGGIP